MAIRCPRECHASTQDALAGASRGGGPSRACNRSGLARFRLAAWCTALPPVVAPVGVADVRPTSPEPFVGGGRGEEWSHERGAHIATGRGAPAPAITNPLTAAPGRASEELDMGKISMRVLSAGLHHDNATKRGGTHDVRFGGGAGS